MTTKKEVNQSLERYYKSLGERYDLDDNTFMEYCRQHDTFIDSDEESLQDVLDFEDLIDQFKDNFPLPINSTQEGLILANWKRIYTVPSDIVELITRYTITNNVRVPREFSKSVLEECCENPEAVFIADRYSKC